jgi:hypothetical protein
VFTLHRRSTLASNDVPEIFDSNSLRLSGALRVGLYVKANSVADVEHTLIVNLILVDKYALVGVIGLSPKEATSAICDDDSSHKSSKSTKKKYCGEK